MAGPEFSPMPEPARRPKEPGVGSAGRLGTGGPEESRAHRATGRATKPQDGWKELGGRRRAEGCRKGGSAGRPRGPQDDRRTGRGQDLRITPETGSARWPKGRRSPQSGWKEPGGQTEGCSPRRQDPRGDWGPRRSKGPRARSGTRGEPRFEPGATRGSQGTLLRAESSDELAGSLAPGRERDPIRKALESEAGARAEGARPCAGNEPLEAARKIGEEKEGRGRGGG